MGNEWEEFIKPPLGSVWDIKIISNNQEFTINNVYFVDGRVMSWYKNWTDFEKIYPNYTITKIRHHKGR
jgi:hypothetical protein